MNVEEEREKFSDDEETINNSCKKICHVKDKIIKGIKNINKTKKVKIKGN